MLARLGIGTVSATTPGDGASAMPVVAAASTTACAPVISTSVGAQSAAGSLLPGHQASHTHRSDQDQTQLRGPPAPFQAPSAPAATAGGGSAAPGGAGGQRDCAIQFDQVVLELSDGGTAVATGCCAPTAPAPTSDGARAPPVA